MLRRKARNITWPSPHRRQRWWHVKEYSSTPLGRASCPAILPTIFAPARRGSEAMPSRVLAVASFVMQPGKQLDCPLKYAAQAEKLLRSNAQ